MTPTLSQRNSVSGTHSNKPRKLENVRKSAASKLSFAPETKLSLYASTLSPDAKLEKAGQKAASKLSYATR